MTMADFCSAGNARSLKSRTAVAGEAQFKDDLRRALKYAERSLRYQVQKRMTPFHAARMLHRDSLRNYGEAQGSEVAVESERGHVIEERGYNYK
jgi:4'-phosphopantetheinyl transferase EntD